MASDSFIGEGRFSLRPFELGGSSGVNVPMILPLVALAATVHRRVDRGVVLEDRDPFISISHS